MLQLKGYFLQNLLCYPGASLCVGEGVVVMLQVVAAGGGNGVELVVGQMGEAATGGDASAVELVVGVVHLVATEDGFQATLVEGFVVGHEGQTLDERFYLRPYFGEDGSLLGVLAGETVHLTAPVVIVVRFGLDEGVEGIDNLAIPYDDNAHGADARPLVVGCLKVYCCKVLHISLVCNGSTYV